MSETCWKQEKTKDEKKIINACSALEVLQQCTVKIHFLLFLLFLFSLRLFPADSTFYLLIYI